jgi:hypothetical protein
MSFGGISYLKSEYEKEKEAAVRDREAAVAAAAVKK